MKDLKIMNKLTESQLIASSYSYRSYSAQQLAEMLYIHLLALRILQAEHPSNSFAERYAKKTSSYGGFLLWVQNETDLYLLLHGLLAEDITLKLPDQSDEFKATLYMDDRGLHKWLKDMGQGRVYASYSRQMFIRLDADLQIKDDSLKNVRRLVQDWPSISRDRKKLAMTRLLQKMRLRCRKSDLLKPIEDLADLLNLEIKNAANDDTGVKAKIGNFLGHAAAFAVGALVGHKVMEDDGGGAVGGDAGGTSADSIAQVNQPLGGVQRRIKKKKKGK